MRRYRIALAALLVLAGLAATPPPRREFGWWAAELRDTARAYSDFAQPLPYDSRLALRAEERASERQGGFRPHPRISDTIFWRWMRRQGSAEAFEEYLDAWPHGRHRAEALASLDDVLWTRAVTRNTVASYQDYLDARNGLPHAREARERQRALRTDDRPFVAAEKAGTTEAWKAFLDDFWGHVRAPEALSRLREADSTDLFRLAHAGRLRLSEPGTKYEAMGVRVGEQDSDTIRFTIAAGTFWQARNHRVPNHMAIEATRDSIGSPGPYWSEVLAVDTDLYKRAAADGDRFRLLPSPPNDGLARLAAYFARPGTGFRVAQAATWVVTDDATLPQLAYVMSDISDLPLALEPLEEDMRFDSDEAAEVLRTITEAGLDPRRYALWQSRDDIFWDELAEDNADWRYLLEIDPAGLGRRWQSVQEEMGRRLSRVDRCFLVALHGQQVEVTIQIPPHVHESGWLAWYLRQLGDPVKVRMDSVEDEDLSSSLAHAEVKSEAWSVEDSSLALPPSDTRVTFDPPVEAQGRAIAEVVRAAFRRRFVETDSNSVTLRGGSMWVDVEVGGEDADSTAWR